MKITKIIGENGTMLSMCNKGACPAALLTDDGQVLVQGYIPVADETLIAPGGEAFVRMSRATFEKIARHVLAS